ncbi:MAG: hypothetical protein MMC33_005850 [Icmadophila ericetorum]|nr:hypothetical protein [Icmadophila ericetorum]
MDQFSGLLSPFGPRSISASSCCAQLARTLGPQLSFPGSTIYQSSLSSYWSLQESTLSPSCILTPTTPQDVSTAVSILSALPTCQFAIKGGTHAPAAGFANINGGVTIDLTSLSSISLNNDHSVASVGAGATWLDAYTYLDTFGISVAGGRNGAVGVGGLTLGGGISYFTPRVGFACDNVVNFEIVLASGAFTNINATSNPSLFRALKGGANNFGVVTRFDLSTFPQGEVFDGSFTQTIEYREDVFQAFANIAGAKEYDEYASIVTGLIFNSTSKAWVIGSTAVYTKPEPDPEVYKDLGAIPNVANSTRIVKLGVLANESATPPLNWLFSTGTYEISAPLLGKIFETLNATIYNFDIPEGILWSIAFEPLPTIVTQYGPLKGGNSLGLSPADGNGIIMLLSALWPSSSSNDVVQNTARALQRNVDAVAQKMGKLHEFRYLNYADPGQDPIGSYGMENVERLRAVSREVDPRGVFQEKVPGGFKLW